MFKTIYKTIVVFFLFMVGKVPFGCAYTRDKKEYLIFALCQTIKIIDKGEVNERDKELMRKAVSELSELGLRTPSLTWRTRQVIKCISDYIVINS
jgi:hypothetical protein